MAGKEGSAAARLMQDLALEAGRLLRREMGVLAEAPPSVDGAGVEKVAKQVKAIADAARSVVALKAACLKAASAQPGSPPPSPSTEPPDSEEMDMDDEPHVACDPDEIARMHDRLERKISEFMGSGEQKTAHPAVRATRLGGDERPLGVGAPA